MTSRLLVVRAAIVGVLLVFAVIALLVGGSGRALAPPRLRRADTTRAAPARAVPTRRSARLGGFGTPRLAVTEFADVYINWSYSNVAARLTALAEASVGQARSAMQLAAAQVSADSTLRGGGIANNGTVEAVAPVVGHPDEWAVVTLEQTTASDSSAYDGLAPAWHVTVASVRREPGGGWVVSGWQPES
jgi:hypothetical protein